MKKFYVILLIAILVLTLATPVLAGGDQVRGEKGQGEVNQVQKMDPPPFQDSTASPGFLMVDTDAP